MDIIKKINSILKEKNINIHLNSSNTKKTFKELGIDSLASMTIIVNLEEMFNIQIDDESLIKLKTPDDVVQIIEKLLKK